MQQIDYDKFPMLHHVGAKEKKAPAPPLLRTEKKGIIEKLEENEAFKDMLPLFYYLNTHSPGLRNYHFDGNTYIKCLTEFGMREDLPLLEKTQYGVLCFPDKAQYLYLFAPVKKKKEGHAPYLAVEIVIEDLFVAFAECWITGEGLKVNTATEVSSRYESMAPFLRFTLVTVDFMNRHAKTLLKKKRATDPDVFGR